MDAEKSACNKEKKNDAMITLMLLAMGIIGLFAQMIEDYD